MRRNAIAILILSLFIFGCGTDESSKEADNQTTNTAIEESKQEIETSKEKTEETKDDNQVISSKETSKNDSVSSSHNESKKTNENSSKTTQTQEPSDKTSSQSVTNSNSSKEESKEPVKPKKEWAMSESKMIEYAKKCIVSYKPTSGYGRCEWYDEFNKGNSGWFAPITISISDNRMEIEKLIGGKINSTLRKATSQIYDDGHGNIRSNIIYPAKSYFEKVDNEQYKLYIFY